MSERRGFRRPIIAFIIIIIVIVIVVPCYFPCFLISPGEATNVFIVRHAEYDASSAPHLNPAGVERAEKLAEVLCEADVEVIYATQTDRAQETAQPLAEAMGLQPIIYYSIDSLVDQIKSDHTGKNVLVVGHAGPPEPMVPDIIDALVGESAGYSIGNDFHNLFVVALYGSGKWKVVNLQYGDAPSCSV